MQLDVIIPTYNRQDLLPSALNSLFAADIPTGLEVVITVIDNNSTDGTRAVVETFQQKFGDRIRYCFERQQGRSHALNAGIKATGGDLIGVIDDDEEIDASWYKTAFEAFSTRELDFIGGPYVPRWSVTPPAWMPSNYGAVVGSVDGGDVEVPFDSNYPGILMGGNAVFKRSVLLKVGMYSTWLGRTDKGLLSGEDEELYGRLLASGARGMYLPQLKIYHHVPAERLTKKYFRSWCFWRGVSLGLLERTRRQSCAYLLGLPRWHYRSAARGLVSGVSSLFVSPREQREAFASELALWDFLGLFYGRHFRQQQRNTEGFEK
ncbi:MAG TPA: glycosyltransferase [Pyrinomonadaceae bacterium]